MLVLIIIWVKMAPIPIVTHFLAGVLNCSYKTELKLLDHIWQAYFKQFESEQHSLIVYDDI